MIIDKELIFSDAQDIGQVAGDYDSAIVNQVKAGGVYDNVWLFLRIDEAVTSGGAATIDFKLRTSSDNFSSSDVILWSSGALALAAMTVDTVIAKVRVPLGVLQYLKMEYTVATATTTAGTVDAMLVSDVNEGF